jgi:tetratricopeptide (TPR) repeat protein
MATTVPRNRWLPALIGLAVVAAALAIAALIGRSVRVTLPEVPLGGLERPLAEAIQEARASVLASPRSADAWGQFGRLLFANDLAPEAGLACFQEAQRLDATNPRWPYFAGAILLNQGKLEGAAVKFQEAVTQCERSRETNQAPRLVLAETLVALDKAEEARTLFQQTLAAEPNNLRAHLGLANLALAQNDDGVAEEHLKRCVGSPQADKQASGRLALLYTRRGDAKNADFWASREARLPKDIGWQDPFRAEHANLSKRRSRRYGIVEELEAAGQFKPALEVLSQLEQEDPDDFLPHVMMGRILPRRGELDLAQAHLLKARSLAPDKIQVHYLLGLVLLERGERLLKQPQADRHQALQVFGESVQSMRQAVKLNPDHGLSHMALGRALLRLGNKEEALHELHEAVHCSPEFSDNHYFLGVALAEQGKLSDARPWLEQALRLAPSNDPRPREALDRFFSKPGPESKH